MRPIAWPSPRPTTLLRAARRPVASPLPRPPSLPPAPAAPEPSVALPPPLERVLRDYESAWQRKDAAALAALFAEDGFVLSSGNPPVRGRAAIERHYSGSGGPLALRALAYSTEGDIGYILGGFARRAGDADVGKFTLTLRRGAGGRWLDRLGHGQRKRPPDPAAVGPLHDHRRRHRPRRPRVPPAVARRRAGRGRQRGRRQAEDHRLPRAGRGGRTAPPSSSAPAAATAASRPTTRASRSPSGSTRSASRPSCSSTAWARATTTPRRSRTRSARSAWCARARPSGASTRSASASWASRPAATSPRPRPRTSTTAGPTPPTRSSAQGSRPDFAVLALPRHLARGRRRPTRARAATCWASRPTRRSSSC